MRWRAAEDLPPSARLICSPYDAQARYAKKRSVEWVGYKVHLTETCDTDTPHLITAVQTTPAPVADVAQLPVIHAELAAHQRLPSEHLVDAGYMSGEQLCASRQHYRIDLLGPVPADTSWQATTPEGLDVTTFAIDWEAQTVTCPHGRVSHDWQPGRDRHGQAVLRVSFAPEDCQSCPVREHCTRAPARKLTLRPRAHHEALQAARERQGGAAFNAAYAARAGVEGTLSQAVRGCDLRRSRYIGLAKTHLHTLLSATALNLMRISAWLAHRPRARTRTAAFAALAPGLA